MRVSFGSSPAVAPSFQGALQPPPLEVGLLGLVPLQKQFRAYDQAVANAEAPATRQGQIIPSAIIGDFAHTVRDHGDLHLCILWPRRVLEQAHCRQSPLFTCLRQASPARTSWG